MDDWRAIMDESARRARAQQDRPHPDLTDVLTRKFIREVKYASRHEIDWSKFDKDKYPLWHLRSEVTFPTQYLYIRTNCNVRWIAMHPQTASLLKPLWEEVQGCCTKWVSYDPPEGEVRRIGQAQGYHYIPQKWDLYAVKFMKPGVILYCSRDDNFFNPGLYEYILGRGADVA